MRKLLKRYFRALGTLQVDSDLTIEQVEFDKPRRRAVAERFAGVGSVTFEDGTVRDYARHKNAATASAQSICWGD